MTKKNDDVAETAVPVKRTNVAAALDADTLKAFEETAWKRRHRRNSDALREAINVWIARHGSVNTGAAPDAKQ